MADAYWFDTLSTLLVQGAPRRMLLRAIYATALGLVSGVAPATMIGKKRKRKRKRKKKQKRDRKVVTTLTCSGRACEIRWPSNSDHDTLNRNHCEFICHQCDGDDPREFCITRPEPILDPERHVAFCCAEGTACFDNACCGRQCIDNPDLRTIRCCGGQCVDTSTDDVHCGGCFLPCGTGEECFDSGCVCQDGALRAEGGECIDNGCDPSCAGNGLMCCDRDCVNTTVDELNCGGCGRLCTGPTPQCCADECVDPLTDPNNCGACGRSCTGPGALCCDGECVQTDRDENNCGRCGFACAGDEVECCDGACVDTLTDPNHCGRCFRGGPGVLCCGGHVYDPDLQFCCPDQLRPCFNSQVCCLNENDIPACCAPP